MNPTDSLDPVPSSEPQNGGDEAWPTAPLHKRHERRT